ncbi:hypothetical protein Tco_0531428 [Tanacetum coccineum]
MTLSGPSVQRTKHPSGATSIQLYMERHVHLPLEVGVTKPTGPLSMQTLISKPAWMSRILKPLVLVVLSFDHKSFKSSASFGNPISKS